jgi:gluconate 2-dehydrogenase gamma chain
LSLLSRREVFRQSAVQATAVWAMLGQTHTHAPEASIATPGLNFLTAAQAREVEAMAAQILPSDDTPGAREAGVIAFIDLVLAKFEREKQAAYTEGLKSLGPFADLASEQQTAKLRSIEKTEFFDLVRTHTIMGFFSHPKYGGNRGGAGWKLIGFEDAGAFQPPFGYYDGPEGGR